MSKKPATVPIYCTRHNTIEQLADWEAERLLYGVMAMAAALQNVGPMGGSTEELLKSACPRGLRHILETTEDYHDYMDGMEAARLLAQRMEKGEG